MPSEGRTDEAEEARAAASGPSADDLAGLGPMVRIGVTGHRDLADREQAETDAAKALCDLLAALESAKWPAGIIGSIPHSPGTVGYRIVSPIAEGGDRAVAALVLSASPGLAARPRELVVPLPF